MSMQRIFLRQDSLWEISPIRASTTAAIIADKLTDVNRNMLRINSTTGR